MAFPSGWGRRCELRIQDSEVSGGLSNFPVLITEDCLPSEMFDADGSYPALNGGGDIRFSSDKEGTNRLSLEVVNFVTNNDPANGVAELWVKVPSISASSTTSIWVWYNKSGESQPSRSAAYGIEAVWSNDFLRVYHMGETGAVDSSPNNDTASSSGSPSVSSSGKIGDCVDFASSTSDYLSFTQPSNQSSCAIFCWTNPDDSGDQNPLVSLNEWGTGTFHNKCEDDDYFVSAYPWPNNLEWTRSSWSGTWARLGYTNDGADPGDWQIWGNGQSRDSGDSNISSAVMPYQINREYTNRYGDQLIDEVFIHSDARDSDWWSAEYNNQDSPETFTIEQTPESPAKPRSFTVWIM